LKEDAMKRTIGFALATGLAFLVAGCAGGAGGSAGGGGASGGAEGSASAGGGQTASNNAAVRDFNLQVKCPGIHLEKNKLKWDNDKIETHENVTEDEINQCESFTASQPKGYIPNAPGGAAPGPQAAGSGAGAAAGGSASGSAGGSGGTTTH
jgi:hypothetical protein